MSVMDNSFGTTRNKIARDQAEAIRAVASALRDLAQAHPAPADPEYVIRRDAASIAGQWAAALGSTSTTGAINLAKALEPYLRGDDKEEA